MCSTSRRHRLGRTSPFAQCLVWAVCACLVSRETTFAELPSPDPAAAPADGETPAAGDLAPLATKQQIIRDRFDRFKDRVFRVRAQLAEMEKDNSMRLGRVLEREGELQLLEQLDQIIKALDASTDLDKAAEAQAKWIADADRLLGILLERDADNDERRNEIERLESYKKEISRLMQEQKALRDQSAQSAVNRRLGQQIDQALKRLEALQKQQVQLSKESARKGDDAAKADQIESQSELSRDTQQLAEDLKRVAELAPESAADSPQAQSARAGAQSASQSLDKGAKSMSDAGESLKKENAEAAKEKQQDAEQKLAEAKKALEDAKKALQNSNQSAAQAQPQRNIAKDTGGLAQKMKQEGAQQSAKKGKSGSKGKSGQSGKSGDQKSAEENLDQAEEHMEDAAEDLDKESPDDATKDQELALKELEKSQEALEELLNQLRKEERAEMLKDLEVRFRELASKQRALNTSTIEVDQIGRDKFTRAEELKLADLSVKQNALGEQAAGCVHILDEEGTTIAFPRIVDQITADMKQVAQRLGELQSGELTQTIQREILDTLEQMLDAIKKLQQENQQPPGGGGGGGANKENQPLLPKSAELKLLRSSQQRVNQRTTAIETARQAGSEAPPSLQRSLSAVSLRQQQCQKIAREIHERKDEP